METLCDLGIDIYGVFNILIPKGTKIPYENVFKIKPTKEYVDFRLYEGIYKNINKNNLIYVFNIDKKNIDEITIILNDKNEVKIKAGDYESNFIKRLNYIECDKYNLYDDNEWYKKEEQRILYMEYILSIKNTLKDEYVIEKINNMDITLYNKIVKKINRAEMICFIDNITLEEFKMANKEVEDFIDPILKAVVLKNKGEIII